VVSLRRADDDCGSTLRYWRSSDGLASGNLLLEAIVHGLCERIERDAVALWQFRSDRDVFTRCIAPAAFGDDAVLGLARQIERAGFHLRLFDISSDVDVPVFFATLSPPPDGFESHWKHFDISSGSGCHPLPARAAIRAITEAAQTRVTSIAGARDDFDPSLYHATAQDDFLTYLRALPNGGAVECAERPEPADNLPFLLARLRKAGISSAILVPIDASEPDFAVAKVLVPELEHPPGERRSQFGKRALRAMAGLQ
jgi:ribosomal protein S12 methylthiotransferase accessory factor